MAAQQATTRIPVVFHGGQRPGRQQDCREPGEARRKHHWRVEFPALDQRKTDRSCSRRVDPNIARLCVLHNPENAGKMLELHELKVGGQASGVIIEPIEVRSTDDLQRVLSARAHFNAMPSSLLRRPSLLRTGQRIAEFAAQNQIARRSFRCEYVEAGGLMSYGLSFCDHYARGAYYVDRVLKGTHPRDLPVELPTTFEFFINLATAKSLGLAVPPSLLARADKVIE